MKLQTQSLGKVSVTVEENDWSISNDYDRLTIVYDSVGRATYVSRIEVPAGIEIDNRHYWTPLGASPKNEDDNIEDNNNDDKFEDITKKSIKTAHIIPYYEDPEIENKFSITIIGNPTFSNNFDSFIENENVNLPTDVNDKSAYFYLHNQTSSDFEKYYNKYSFHHNWEWTNSFIQIQHDEWGDTASSTIIYTPNSFVTYNEGETFIYSKTNANVGSDRNTSIFGNEVRVYNHNLSGIVRILDDGTVSLKNHNSYFFIYGDKTYLTHPLYLTTTNCEDLESYSNKNLINDNSIQKNILDLDNRINNCLIKSPQTLTSTEKNIILNNLGITKSNAFDDLWVEAGYDKVNSKNYSSIDYTVNAETHYILNGIRHNYSDAMHTYIATAMTCSGDCVKKFNGWTRLKTTFPIEVNRINGFDCSNMFTDCYGLETIIFVDNDNSNAVFSPSKANYLFDNCIKLKEVIGVIECNNNSNWDDFIYIFVNCDNLEEIKIKIKGDLDLHASSKVSYDSLNYIVSNAHSSVIMGNNPAIIKVHEDTYSKLTGATGNPAAGALTEDELNQWISLSRTAINKHITFETV